MEGKVFYLNPPLRARPKRKSTIGTRLFLSCLIFTFTFWLLHFTVVYYDSGILRNDNGVTLYEKIRGHMRGDRLRVLGFNFYNVPYG
jgi:hypothetical protein